MIVAVVKYSPGFDGNGKAIDLAVDLQDATVYNVTHIEPSNRLKQRDILYTTIKSLKIIIVHTHTHAQI